MPKCSIIIPVYNHAVLTTQCLDTILATPPHVAHEIIVVDDASADATPQVLDRYGDHIRVLTQAENSGFATACNAGAHASAGEYLIFLNNDTIPQPGWLDALASYADAHPHAAVVGSKLLYPDETIQHAGVAIGPDRFPRHLYKGFPKDHRAVNTSRQFPIVTAACALFRREPFVARTGFDPSFHNAFEDVDLCLRLGVEGWEVHYCHESVLYHLESATRDAQSEHDRANVQRYLDRWRDQVEPDDLRYYIEDALITISYDDPLPPRVTVSPPLSVVANTPSRRSLDHLLRARAQQVSTLLHETIRLSTHVAELEMRNAAERGDGAPAPSTIMEKIVELRAVLTETNAATDATGAAVMPLNDDRPLSLKNHAQLLKRDTAIEGKVHDLQTTLVSTQNETAARPNASSSVSPFVANTQLGYQQTLSRVRDLVADVLPRDATVLVVSKGDDALLDLDGRRAWHFPQSETGVYAGYHPANSVAAIMHLEALRAKGAGYLLFPATARWWLDYYREFRLHLDERYQEVVHDDACIVYALRNHDGTQPVVANHVPRQQHDQLLAQIRGVVASLLPEGAIVLVASHGDDTFLNLGDHRGWHFPPRDAGGFTDDLPSSAAAIAQLEGLRAKGAHYLLVPGGLRQRFIQYPGFRSYVEEQYEMVCRQRYLCDIFAL